jgi:hypothetical protein
VQLIRKGFEEIQSKLQRRTQAGSKREPGAGLIAQPENALWQLTTSFNSRYEN